MSEPDQSAHPEQRLDEVIAAYLRAVREGHPPSEAKLLAQHPDLADELARFLADRQSIERLAAPLRGPEGVSPTPQDAVTQNFAPGETLASVPVHVGRTVAGYEILDEVARGGMGIVYRARQPVLGRIVALKMILSGAHADEAERARLRTEAEAIARLQHPNIVQIFEVGEHEGLPFLALEFCSGGNLSGKLAGTPLQPMVAARLVEVLARAVGHAHAQKIVHRDLKPANVLLVPSEQPEALLLGGDQQRFELKVTDFGLAKQLEQSGQTATGAVLGTPSYMAPEQAGGKTREIGPAADVYALGAILYECLTGRPPFSAPTPLDTVLQVLNAEPVPVRQLQPQVPRDLETIALKCLRKHPGQRYADCAALADDLRRYLDGKPIVGRRPSWRERLVRWAWREPRLAAATAAALVLFVATVVIAFFQWRLNEELKVENALRLEHAQMSEQQYRVSQYGKGFDRALLTWQSGDVKTAQKLLDDLHPGLASWEWDFLQKLCLRKAEQKEGADKMGLVARRWPEPLGKVSALAVSPDGQLIATGVYDTIKVREAVTGRVTHSFMSPGGYPNGLAFSPDGKRFASCVSELLDMPSLRIWDAMSCQTLLGLECENIWRGRVYSRALALAYSSDGLYLATCDGGPVDGSLKDPQRTTCPGAIRLWNAGTGELSGNILPDHGCCLRTVAFSPDGQRLVAGGSAFVRDKLDGKGSESGVVGMWNVAKKTQLLSLIAPHSVDSVAFSPSGDQILGGSWDGAVHIWDANSGSLVRTVQGHAHGVWTVLWHPSGKQFVSRGGDEMLRVWDTATGKAIRAVPLAANKHWIRPEASFSRNDPSELFWHGAAHSFVISPDGKYAFTAGDAVRQWELASSREFRTFDSTSWVSALALSSDGKRLLGAGNNQLALWDAESGKAIISSQGCSGRHIRQLAFSSDSRRLFSVTGNHVTGLQEWDLASGRSSKPPGNGGWPLFASAGRLIALHGPNAGHWGGKRVKLELEDLTTNRQIAALEDEEPGPIWRILSKWQHANSIPRCLALDSGQRYVAFGGGAGQICLWNLATDKLRSLGEHMEAASHHGGVEVTSVAFSPDGQKIVSSRNLDKQHPQLLHGKWSAVEVWETETGKQLFSFTIPIRLQGLFFSLDGRRIVGFGEARRVKLNQVGKPVQLHLTEQLFRVDNSHAFVIWDSITGQEVLAVGEEANMTALAFAPNNRYLVGADANDRSLKLWDAAVGDECRTLRGHADEVPCVAFSPDNKHIVSCGGYVFKGASPNQINNSSEAKVWDVASGQAIMKLDDGGSKFNHVAYSPDGRLIISADSSGGMKTEGHMGGAVKIWDAQTGKRIAVLGHQDSVYHATFSPDNSCIASVDKKGLVKIWEVPTWKEVLSFETGYLPVRFSPDSRFLTGATSVKDPFRRLSIWDRVIGAKVITTKEHGYFHNVRQSSAQSFDFGAMYSPDGHHLAVATRRLEGGGVCGVAFLDASTGKRLQFFPSDHFGRVTFSFSPDGKFLVIATREVLKIYGTATAKEVQILRGHLGDVLSLDWSRDGRYIVSGSADRLIKLWDVSHLTGPAR